MSEEIIYTMKGVSKVYSSNKYVLKDIYLSYFYGAKIGVLGLNGSGKSSLLKIMAGVDTEFLGDSYPAKDFKLGYLEQEPQLDGTKTVKENIMSGLGELAKDLADFNDISQEFEKNPDMAPEVMEKLIERQGVIQERIESQDGWEVDQKIDRAMEALRCPPADSGVVDLSGGEKRRVALCRLLLSAPDILLLDEPTNHLDAESVAWLEHYLGEFPGTVIAVTHDRYFLDNVAGWILELDRGEGIPFKGNYSSWLEQKDKRLRVERQQESKKAKTLQRELEWIRMSPAARQTKSKARIAAYEDLLKEPSAEALKEMQIYIPPGPRLGNIVVNFENVGKSFGQKILFEDFSFQLPRGAVVGLVGPNGAGKTTLFKMIVGQEKPDDGNIKIGETVKLAYVDQERETLNGDNPVWKEMAGGEEIFTLGKREINVRAYLSRFNFHGDAQQKKVKDLSGGERNRLNLAKMLCEEANFLLLDEPTNDLDVNTMRALEEGISRFGGSVMITSHDRWFLDRVCTHIIGFEGDSQVVWFTGSYSDYEQDLKKRLGVETLVPKRIKYRRIH